MRSRFRWTGASIATKTGQQPGGCMKSPSRRLRRLVGAGTAALLAVGLAPILTSGVAQAASTNTPAIGVANQTVIGVGQSGSAAGDMTVGSSTVTFNAGDQITVQVTQPGVGTPT